MDTCHQCGAGVNTSKTQCGTCGTSLPVSRRASADGDVSPYWREKFALIEKAGGASLSKLKQLTFMERFRLMFNWRAFLFGTFYYVVKGMWRKALSRLTIALLLTWLISETAQYFGLPQPGDMPVSMACAMVYAVWANVDYYKKIVLGENGWW